MHIQIDEHLLHTIPTFKLGAIEYEQITVDESPQMIKGRFHLFQESLLLDLLERDFNDFAGIREWRELFKLAGTNPKRYPPSNEALYNRVKRNGILQPVHSAVDVNNFFSLKYEIPLGIYNIDEIKGDVLIRLGQDSEQYEGINGRMNSLKNKIISADELGPFGSPYVDSVRTKVSETTTSALHLIYLRPSISAIEAKEQLEAIGKMFCQIHGGQFKSTILGNFT